MNRRLITYNYLKTIANGSIHFHAFSYQYPGTGNPIRIDIWLTDNCKFCSALLNELESLKGLISEFYLNIYPLCSSSTKYSPLTTRICRLCNSTYLQDGALKDIKESAVNLGISAFPTIAINGRILPSHLTLSDIVYSKCG